MSREFISGNCNAVGIEEGLSMKNHDLTRNIQMRVPISIAAIVIVGLIAGCSGGTVDPQPGTGSLDIAADRTVNESGFYFDGTVTFRLSIEESEMFENVMLCGYTERGDVLFSDNLGSFTTPSDRANFSVHSERVPAYIAVDQGDFRDFDGFSPETFVRIENGDSPSYQHSSGYLDEVQSEFSYPRNDLQGQCG